MSNDSGNILNIYNIVRQIQGQLDGLEASDHSGELQDVLGKLDELIKDLNSLQRTVHHVEAEVERLSQLLQEGRDD